MPLRSFAAGAPCASLERYSTRPKRPASALARWCLAGCGLTAWCLAGLWISRPGLAEASPRSGDESSLAAADAIQGALVDEPLRALVKEVLKRNPEIARKRQRAAAAEVRAPQARALPDPEVSLSVFALPPETRVGPQQASVAIHQSLPWFGKLTLRERMAFYAAEEAQAEVAALRLRLITRTRRLFYELSFLRDHAAIIAEEREHLLRHEEVARARYSAGMGLQQEALKIQADITRAETRLVEIEAQRRSLLASLNALRDRPADVEFATSALPYPRSEMPPLEELRRRARQHRPELAAARAEIDRQQTRVELAGKESRPDLKVGLGYTRVGRRRDEPGRLNPPSDDGDDILSISVGARLPVWKRKLEAGLEEALSLKSAAEERQRQILSEIEGQIGEAVARLPFLYRQWKLFEDVLLAQAEEALSSSEAAYTTGKLNALDLLDAEHVLFEVRTAAARTQADHAIVRAELEGAIGQSLLDFRVAGHQPQEKPNEP